MIAAYARDVRIVFLRELRPQLLAPWALGFSLLQPLLMLALFAPVLTGLGADVPAAGAGGPDGGGPAWGGTSAIQWFVPGVLVMIMLFATSGTGANLLGEMQSGAHERMLVTPLARSSLIVGRALQELAPVVAQAVLVVAVAMPLGFRPHVPGLLTGLAMLGVLGVGVGALSYTLAIAVKGQDWIFWLLTQSLTFPLLVLSGLLLPLDTAPGWMRAAAAVDPLAHVVTAERALLGGEFPLGDVLAGFGAAGATAAVGLAVGVRVMRRAR